jgi:hypothetical protein
VITFAGEAEQQGVVILGQPQKPAITLQALTNDYERVEHALDSVLANGPAGLTHIAAGVDQATIELMGIKGALSRKDPNSEKIVLFFTDGVPTLPHGPQFEAENVRAVLRAAGRSQYSNIRIHSFAIGPEALDGPIATVEMARRTGGYFTPVRHPGMLSEAVETVDFANLHEVVLKNATNGKVASPFRLTADGSWSGFLPLENGTPAGPSARGWCAWIPTPRTERFPRICSCTATGCWRNACATSSRCAWRPSGKPPTRSARI